MTLRIRQIVFAVRDLASAIEQFEKTLGLRVAYRDPAVATFGLENALLPIGDQFLEIVAPTRADTAAGRHLERHGDSAYMLILQTDDLARDRARLERLGVRIVWQASHPDMSSVQLHPKDIGAAIVSLDQATPPSSWRWAGPGWNASASSTAAPRILEATIQARHPAIMAQRWCEVLGLEAPQETGDNWRVPISEGALNFARSLDGRETITEYVIAVPESRKPVTICGTKFVLREFRQLAESRANVGK